MWNDETKEGNAVGLAFVFVSINIQYSRLSHPPQTLHSSRRRWCSAAVMLTIVAGAAVLVLFYGSSIWDRLAAAGDQIPPFFTWDDGGEDPLTSEEFKNWYIKSKNGLELTIVNAMSSDWYQYFNEAVDDWDRAPALKLSVEIAPVDPDCKLIPGKLKCCNNFYGESGWSGLNESWLNDKGIITASIAKMNETYLKGKPYAEKRYVTCHEIGHGFGLPHRDVNVNNPNLGTCLDYTTSYASNVSPDETDFAHLENLYGKIGDRRRSLLRKQSIVNSSNNNNNKNDQSPQSTPNTYKQRSYKDGRLLYKSETKEIYEEILPEGGKIISTLLLANTR